MKNRHPGYRLRFQRGLTLIEVLGALFISALVLVGSTGLVDRYTSWVRLSNAAEEISTFGTALGKYASDNSQSLLSTATATTPVLIPISAVNTAYGTNFTDTDVYGHAMCGLVLQPTSGSLISLVVTEGGTALDDSDLGNLAAAIGASGGGIYSTSVGTLTGTNGQWSLPVGNYGSANNLGQHCNGSPGAITFAAGHPVVAIWFAATNNTAGVLYRNAIPGQPQLNQMNTPIVMSSLATAGTACTSVGAIAQNANQTSLVVCGTNNLWNTVGNSVAGIVAGGACSTPNQIGSDANNVAYDCNGAFWAPIQTFATYSSSTPTGCATNNAVATSIQTGEMLVCRNNVYVRLANLIPSSPQSILVTDQQFVPAPACDWGGTPWGNFETINTTADVSKDPPRPTMKLASPFVTSPQPGWNISIVMEDPDSDDFDGAYETLTQIFHYGCSY